MMTRTILVASSLCFATGALAQDAADQTPDPVASIVGSWSNAKEGRESASAMHISPVSLEGADGAYYVEYTNADAINEVERQEVWRTYRTADGWRLRVLGFRYEQYARLRYGGLWVGEDLLPEVLRVEVYPTFDMDITIDGSGFSAATPHRYPISDGDSMEIEASVVATPDALIWDATRYGADGSVTWEAADDELSFHPYEPPVSYEKRDDGLVIIDLKQGDGPGAVNGDTIAMHYTGWNTRYQVFDSSRRPGREPYPLTLPGQVIRGWQEGLVGIQVGTVRRLIIPSDLGYGPSGRGQLIPPNEDLHFETECMSLTQAQAEPAGDDQPSEDDQ